MRADNSTLVWCIGLQDFAKQCAESFEELNSKDKQVRRLPALCSTRCLEVS